MNKKRRTLWESFDSAVRGIIEVLQTQRNMRIHFLVAIAILIVSLFIGLTKIELIFLALAIAFVLVSEIINTAIELIVDIISPEFRDEARRAKDISAGAVLISAINAVIVGYLIFFTKLIPKFPNIISKIQYVPPYLTFIALLLVIFAVLVGKAISGHGKKVSLLHGGMPSGHSALAFACWAIVVFLSKDLLISVLTFFLSFLVSWSRVKDKVHNLKEVIFGALLGFLITALIFQLFS